MILGNMSASVFLSRYWQQRPLLIKNAFPAFSDPLSPEELAGLACEAEVEARLVFTRKNSWELKTGPFTERDFTSLPARNWTLLVQAVDQWVPEVKALLQGVSFIPSWRVDDVMISYATANGGVGPHFDYYDVFLVQGQGSRLWKTGQHCTSKDIVRSGSGLKLLKDFHCENEWLLEPGDVLYVPPGIAHWGVSKDNSLCYSIGFRAPSLSEMLQSFSDSLGEQFTSDERYTDPKMKQAPQAGEIDASALKQARRLLKQALGDELAFARWFGCHMTEPKYPELIFPAESHDHDMLVPNPASRFAWQQHKDTLLIFADGVCLQVPATPALLKFAQLLAQPEAVIPAAPYRRNKASRELLDSLLAQGSLLPDENA